MTTSDDKNLPVSVAPSGHMKVIYAQNIFDLTDHDEFFHPIEDGDKLVDVLPSWEEDTILATLNGKIITSEEWEAQEIRSGDSAGAVQVTGPQGEVHTQRGSTYLEWSPSPAADSVLGYRIYRASREEAGVDFQVLDTVLAEVHSYTDQTAACGYMYFVTAFNAAGESLPSTASYFSPACR